MKNEKHPAEGAHYSINEKNAVRPYDEKNQKDGNFNFVHRMDAHQAVDQAWKEGVELLAGYLIERGFLVEQTAMELAQECINAKCPMHKFIDGVK